MSNFFISLKHSNKMFLRSLVLSLFCGCFICFYTFSQETVTITTYYPSPAGIYNRIVTMSMGVGDTNSSGALDAADAPDPVMDPGSIWIAGNLGIATINPLNRLDIAGNAAIGSAYAGAIAAPSNGLLVEGDTGIGVNDPNFTSDADLVINNTLRLTPNLAPIANLGGDLEGALYYDSSTHRLRYHDNNDWKDIGSSSLGATTSDLLSSKITGNSSFQVTCPNGYIATEVLLITNQVCTRNGCGAIEIEKIGLRCRQLQ